MSRERVLTTLVVFDVLLAFAVIGAEMFFGWTLPGSLREHVVSQMQLPSTPWEVGLVALWAGSVGLTVASWIALLSFWWFARRLYLVAWTTWVLLTLLSGPSVLTSVGAMFSTLEAVVAGMILGLVYFSDLSRYFERRAAGVVERATAAG